MSQEARLGLDARRARLEVLARRLSEEEMAEGAARVEMLRVRVGEDRLLVPAERVAEVVRPVHLTPVPMGPSHLLGLASVHGQIWCIVDLAGLMPVGRTQADLPASRFVLLRHPKMHVGFRVDAAEAMHAFEPEAVNGLASEAPWMLGRLPVGEEQLAVLNVDAVLA